MNKYEYYDSCYINLLEKIKLAKPGWDRINKEEGDCILRLDSFLTKNLSQIEYERNHSEKKKEDLLKSMSNNLANEVFNSVKLLSEREKEQEFMEFMDLYKASISSLELKKKLQDDLKETKKKLESSENSLLDLQNKLIASKVELQESHKMIKDLKSLRSFETLD